MGSSSWTIMNDFDSVPDRRLSLWKEYSYWAHASKWEIEYSNVSEFIIVVVVLF